MRSPDSRAAYPAAVELASDLLQLRREHDPHGRELSITILQHGIVHQAGREEFRVLINQLRDLPEP
jgi:hypothetical protein